MKVEREVDPARGRGPSVSEVQKGTKKHNSGIQNWSRISSSEGNSQRARGRHCPTYDPACQQQPAESPHRHKDNTESRDVQLKENTRRTGAYGQVVQQYVGVCGTERWSCAHLPGTDGNQIGLHVGSVQRLLSENEVSPTIGAETRCSGRPTEAARVIHQRGSTCDATQHVPRYDPGGRYEPDAGWHPDPAVEPTGVYGLTFATEGDGQEPGTIIPGDGPSASPISRGPAGAAGGGTRLTCPLLLGAPGAICPAK